MCTVCGCGTATIQTDAKEFGHETQATAHDHGHHVHYHHHERDQEHGYHRRQHDDGRHDHGDEHDHSHVHAHEDGEGAIDFGGGMAGVHIPGMSQDKILRIERDILGKNNTYADDNRAKFAEIGVLVLNLVSGPGSGKTTLLVRAIEDLKARFPIAVIEGDQQTSNDAARIRATGAPAIQINTGKGCHLDAHMVGHAADSLDLRKGGVLFIENVGNLVCPAAFDLGEAHKIVVLSVTEGEDKPLKYPDMFAAADLMLLNKCDLLPHLSFDVGECLANALKVNPRLQTLIVSAQTGEGLASLYAWIDARVTAASARSAKITHAHG